MTTPSCSHIPFAELSAQARVMFFLNALAALARYDLQRPELSTLEPLLEEIWNGNKFSAGDFSDPYRMTALLKAHFASIKVASIGDIGHYDIGDCVPNEHNKYDE